MASNRVRYDTSIQTSPPTPTHFVFINGSTPYGARALREDRRIRREYDRANVANLNRYLVEREEARRGV